MRRSLLPAPNNLPLIKVRPEKKPKKDNVGLRSVSPFGKRERLRTGKGTGSSVSRLSIIIPFFRDTPMEAFEETLASVLAYRPEDTEILIADAGGYTDPWNVGGEGVRFLSLSHRSNPVDILNDAVRTAAAPIVHLLYAGTDVSEQWTQLSLECFDDPRRGVVIPTVFDRLKSKRVFAMGVVFSRGGSLRTIRRSQLSQVQRSTIAPHISAVFFRKAALEQVGGLERSFMPQLAYVDAAFFLNEFGWTTWVDDRSRIFVRPNMLPAAPPFSWAQQLERLYFRWMGRQTSLGSVGTHLGALAADFWRHFPRWKAFQALFGRLAGLFSLYESPLLTKQIRLVVAEQPTQSPKKAA